MTGNGPPMVFQLGIDGERTVLEILQGETPLAHMWVDAEELSAIISILAERRAGLADQVIPEMDPGTRAEAVIEPAWYVTLHGEQRLLSLRHPGYGWTHFLLSKERAATIAGHLASEAG